MYEVRVIHQAGNYEACRKNHRGSRGMRDYSEKDLINFANNNPGVAVYLKPRRHRSPCIKAEYYKVWIGATNSLPHLKYH
ncbi:large ribosomal subunit protein mL43-like isoform X2 [Oratosquilla oratoria]|uniref:large ribosomal subunit protein mL43-like isoform X2 n=1 Tax=Oratosquilla oratoria TaxID=337810 RepID=UPI003F75EB96